MLPTNVTLLLKNDNIFITNQKERKTRLLRLFGLIAIWIEVAALLNLTVPRVVTGKFEPSIILTLLVFLGATLLSRWLAGRGYYNIACWLLIGTNTLVVIGCYLLYGTGLPMLIGFLLPIALCSVLLEPLGTILLCAVCITFTVGLTFAQDVMKCYTPLLVLNSSSLATSTIFFAVVLIPALVAIMIVPARQQARAMLAQNKELAKALEELAARQQAGQEVSQKVLKLSAELKTTSSQQASGSQEQAASLSQVNTSIMELSSTASNIAELAEQVAGSTKQMAADSGLIEQTAHLSVSQSQQGITAVERTVEVSQIVGELYHEVQETLGELNAKSANMRQILELLSSIAGETHLLALNASIEAAGAGEFGVRFGVVAQEIKHLADRSSRASQNVVAVVQQVEEATLKAVNKVEMGYLRAQEMEQVAGEAGTVIEGMRRISAQVQSQATSISQRVQEVRELCEVIKMATNQQRSASEQVLSAISGVSVVAKQNAESSVSVSSTAIHLEEMSHNLTNSLAA